MHRLLEAFDPSRPIEDSRTPPYSWYVDQEFFQLEKEHVFQRCWLPAGRVEQVEKPGAYITGEVMGNPYVVVRGTDGKLYAHHNACRHKGAAVAMEEGRCQAFVCPYHGWEYNHDGSLKKAPHLGKQVSFNAARNGLSPMCVDTWGPFLFIDMDGPFGHDGSPRKLHEDLAPLKEPLEKLGFNQLRWCERHEYVLNCNWKVFVDNGLDGGYHVAYAHEGLSQGLEFEGYETTFEGRTSVQVCSTRGSDERLGDQVMYAWFFPNFFINRYGHCMDTNIVLPLTPNSCKVIFDFYFDYENFEDWDAKKRIRNSIADSHTIQEEDVAICESAQRGMNSMSWRYGRYSSSLERAVHAFHVLLWKELKGMS